MNTIKAIFQAFVAIFLVAVVLLFSYIGVFAIYESGIRSSAAYACRDKIGFDAEMCRMEFMGGVMKKGLNDNK